MNKLLSLLFAGLVSAVSVLAPSGVLAADLQPGRDYTVINPPLPAVKDKIEVVEFFSYACPHCSEFNPFLKRYTLHREKK